ncbi:MAG: PaaI family thioesterase [Alphaproteobacteria bacterium]|nr:MAG: PaaI family thioesterase [Alphaproteobacteria bacterium]
MEDAKARVARQFIEAIPHSKALGMRLDALDAGVAVISMDWDPRFVGDPQTEVIHGGAVSALMDTCCGAAVMSHPSAPASTATLDLRIDYMRPATPRQRITARAECHHVTRTVAFVRAVAHDEDADRPVAMASGAFTVEPSSGRGRSREKGDTQ